MMTKKNDYLMPVTSKQIFEYLRRTFHSFVLGINIFTLLLLLSSFLSWGISPARTLIFAYLGLAFPFILMVNLLLLVFWCIISKWKIALFNVIVLAICYSPITTYFPINIFSGTPPEGSIKILSYNVRGFNWELNKKWSADMPMVQYLKSVDADIICMQEYVVSTSDKHASTRNLQKVLKVYPYYSVIPLRPSNGRYEYGLACFSKYPIKSILSIPIVSSDNGVALYKIEVNGKIITVINNHLESNRLTSADKKLYKDFLRARDSHKLDEVTQSLENKLGSAFRKRAPQVNMVARYVEEQTTDAIIVCGDFNDSPISYSYKTIKKDLLDSYAETGFGPGITYHENYFWFRIDFIMHSRNLKAYKCTVDKVKFSDHYPIWTYLHFK
ncbi:endonuclease/exonuclease/phosphatase family protein [Dysgonomonas sp. GY617]|uniref:endonuclease/exonuclease/phosphatase family protein n=2 Tax=unclassified Dysgonomonas TaxID=2630389 RepID=UPI0018841A19|nr:endonuclease/exonuclease/phosphatase family protein [Dysgonomonas sp. GY617]MBF0576163.1 endonuclease/exonuclease/phosphatase family protein [Dysgonomonas sp. GY617]